MKKTDWKQMWKEDVNSMIATMLENMACDARYGYDAGQEYAGVSQANHKIHVLDTG